MSSGKSNTSSKRKKSTPKKFKSRKLFASSGNDLSEEPELSTPTDEGEDEKPLNSPKLPSTPRNKENVPAKCPYMSAATPRGRGRPKGSKNKTFPACAPRVHAMREAKSAVDPSRTWSDRRVTVKREVIPNRGRGRPKGTTKVKQEAEDAPKRARGRPKGSKNKKPSKTTLTKMLGTSRRRGRGRPRKNPESGTVMLTPKRGRPKGSVNKVTYAKMTMLGTSCKIGRGRPRKNPESGTTMLTPKRGRPKGSLNKVTYAKMKMLVTGQKMGRGRPRKNPEIGTEMLSPKRGRPKGSLNKVTYAKMLSMMELDSLLKEEAEDSDDEEEEEDDDEKDYYDDDDEEDD